MGNFLGFPIALSLSLSLSVDAYHIPFNSVWSSGLDIVSSQHCCAAHRSFIFNYGDSLCVDHVTLGVAACFYPPKEVLLCHLAQGRVSSK
jgi:hypothetical protein